MQYSFDKSFPGSKEVKVFKVSISILLEISEMGGHWFVLSQYINIEIDAKDVGFDDSFIYDELELKPADRKLPSETLLRNEAIKAFEMWDTKADKIEY